MSFLSEAFGKSLKSLRKNAGFSKQEALAERLSVDVGSVSRWESGDYLPSNQTIDDLPKLLKVTPEQFLREMGRGAGDPTHLSFEDVLKSLPNQGRSNSFPFDKEALTILKALTKQVAIELMTEPEANADIHRAVDLETDPDILESIRRLLQIPASSRKHTKKLP